MTDNSKKNQQTLARHLEAESKHDAATAASTYVEDSFYENCALGIRMEGRDMVEFQYAASYDLIPDIKAEYQFEHVGDDIVVQAGRITGAAKGSLLGLQANGGQLDFPFTAVITFRDGKMTGERVFYDLEQFCQQAGLDVAQVREAAKAFQA